MILKNKNNVIAILIILVFVFFLYGFFLGYQYHSIEGRSLVCNEVLIKDTKKKNFIKNNYKQIENPFFSDFYDKRNITEMKNIYVEKNSKDKSKSDHNCFSKEDVDPRFHKVYLETEKGDLYCLMCSK